MTLAVQDPAVHQEHSSPLIEAAERVGLMRLSLEQYRRMVQTGIIGEDDNVELLNGLIVRKDNGGGGTGTMGHDPIHRLIVALLIQLALKVDSDRRHLSIQLPIECPPDGIPEPDAAIVRGAPRDYVDGLPTANDVSCVIEAAHSSLHRDREQKLRIYAAARIPQYVLIDLVSNHVEVYTEPDAASGQYQTKRTFAKGQRVGLVLPDGVLEVEAGEILP